MTGRGPSAPPIPSAASFNTERDLRGTRPGKTLEQKAQFDARRSSYCESSSRTIVDDEDEATEKQEDTKLPEEPTAPKPGATRSNPMANILQPIKPPVILTSKPVYSSLYKNKMKREGEGMDST